MPWKRILGTTILAMPLLISTQLYAVDISRGKDLHDGNCTQCHISLMGSDGSGIYTRENRRIHSLDALNKQVHRCKDSLGTSWPEDQIQDVVGFLNKKYYKFAE